MSGWYSYETTPRFFDTDAYGIVHHSAHYQWLEEARFAFAKERLDFTAQNMSDRNIRVMVLESSCRYLIPARYGDHLRIDLQMVLHKAAKIGFRYRIKSAETNRTYAEATTTHVYVRPDGSLLLTHPDWLVRGARRVMDEHPDEISLGS